RHKEWFDSSQEKFVSVVDRTLQGYCDQNLSIHKLHLHLLRPDSRPAVSLLNKWIPILALNIKAFKLNFLSFSLAYYDLPSAVFLAESLEELNLGNCRLSPVESLRFKCLRTLTLEKVQFDGGTFENITSGCPLLKRLVLNNCQGLRNFKALPGHNHFALCDFKSINETRSIEINVPNLETVTLSSVLNYVEGFGFRLLASNYLGIKEHVLFDEIEDLLRNAKETPAEVAEELLKGDDADVAL
ncbi:F-box/RNI-like superfamily protein, partial [Striga asiatica]